MRLDRLDYIPILSTFNAVIRLIDVLTGRIHQLAVRSLYQGEEPSKASRLGRAAITAIPGLNLLTIPYDLFRAHQAKVAPSPIEIELKEFPLLGSPAPSPLKHPEFFKKGVYYPVKDDLVVYETEQKGFFIYGRVIATNEKKDPPTALITFAPGMLIQEVVLPAAEETPSTQPIGPLYKLHDFKE